MDYDPIKDRLAGIAARHPLLQRGLYRALDTVFLRTWYVHRAARRLLRRIDEPVVRVLDAGTGLGQYAYWLLRHDERVRMTAVDVKADYLEAARRAIDDAGLARRAEFRVHDLTQPLDEEDAYDLALSVDVMEHIEDDRAVFANIARALRPGAHLIVNTPSDQGGSDADLREEGFIGEHVRPGYAPEDLVSKLADAGLETVEWTYTYGPLGSAAWRLLVKTPMRLLDKSWALAPLLVPYYAVGGPAGLLLNAADVRARKSRGTGLLVVARRPPG